MEIHIGGIPCTHINIRIISDPIHSNVHSSLAGFVQFKKKKRLLSSFHLSRVVECAMFVNGHSPRLNAN